MNDDLCRGRALLQSLKAVAGDGDPQLSIIVQSSRLYSLRPVATTRAKQSKSDVKHLTEWRNKFVSSFLTEFVATETRTSHWLAEHVAKDDTRILFMLDNEAGRSIAYLGLAFIDWETGYGEADAIVRGVPGKRGVMRDALSTLLRWARNQLGLKELGVRVRSDNPALEFYRRANFRELKRVPLSCCFAGSERTWFEDENKIDEEVSLVYMFLNT